MRKGRIITTSFSIMTASGFCIPIRQNGITSWPGYVKEAVKQLDDKNIYTLFVPYKKTPGHPGKKEQQVLADSLIRMIKTLG